MILYGISLFCHKQTAGFQMTKVVSHLPSSPQWELPQEGVLVEEYLKQPFYYLDKGGQSYAFLSQDGKVVLKLFKMHNLRQYPYAYKMTLPGILDQLRLKMLCGQKEKLNRLFNSCHLAYTQLKEETALIYLNLNPNPDLESIHVTLIDKLGIAHNVSLKKIPFALQERVNRALNSLKVDFKNNDLLTAKEKIKQMITCLQQRLAKGIIDIDPAFKRNMGFSEKRAILMDIGAFFLAQQPLSQEDLIQETQRLRCWLEKRSPEMADYIDSLVEGTSADNR